MTYITTQNEDTRGLKLESAGGKGRGPRAPEIKAQGHPPTSHPVADDAHTLLWGLLYAHLGFYFGLRPPPSPRHRSPCPCALQQTTGALYFYQLNGLSVRMPAVI